MAQTKQHVQANLNLATEPNEELMALLAELGDSDVVEVPMAAAAGRTYLPIEIERIVIEGTVGDLVAHAREEAHASLATIGKSAAVARACSRLSKARTLKSSLWYVLRRHVAIA